jgi:hypothetical protein
MKITKHDFKELLREQVKTVVDEVWIKVGDDEPPLPSHSEHGPYAPEEEEGEGPPVDDVEWMEDRFHQDQEDWPDEEELPGPGDRPAWEDDASHPDSPDYEEEEGVVDLRGKTPTRQSIARLKHRIKQHTGEEPVDLGTWDPRTGKVRVKESELKDMIRTTLEEVMDEVEEGTALGTPWADKMAREQGASSRKEKERKEKERKKKEGMKT